MQSMSNVNRKPAPASTRAARQDGDATRQQLLEVAGQVFAERGFGDATSKEICARANTNLAAVNYHFGSRDQLYEAVLIEAHNHLLKLEDMQATLALQQSARAKLTAIVTGIASRAAAPGAHWSMKVVIRELLSPTPFAPALVNQAIAPKAKVMMQIVCDYLDLPPTSQGAQRGLMFMMGGFLILLLAPQGMRQAVFPSLASDPATVVDDMLCYAFGGLDAIRNKYRAT